VESTNEVESGSSTIWRWWLRVSRWNPRTRSNLDHPPSGDGGYGYRSGIHERGRIWIIHHLAMVATGIAVESTNEVESGSSTIWRWWLRVSQWNPRTRSNLDHPPSGDGGYGYRGGIHERGRIWIIHHLAMVATKTRGEELRTTYRSRCASGESLLYRFRTYPQTCKILTRNVSKEWFFGEGASQARARTRRFAPFRLQ
jgi:hypothetical protein